MHAHRNLPPDTPKDPVPGVHHETLGYMAVAHLHNAAANYQEADLNQEDPYVVQALEQEAETSLALMSVHLGYDRQKVTGLNSMQANILENFCDSSVPQSLRDHKQRMHRDVSWKTWLGGGADDKELRAFLEWHVDNLREQQQNPEVQSAIEAQRELYKLGLASGVREGWLDDDALAAARAVDHVKVYIGDVFDTLMQDRGGYHMRGTSEIVIAAQINSQIGEAEDENLLGVIKDYAGHEFNHAVLGRLGRRWLDEALTEHINLALKRGEVENADLDNGVYIEERLLLQSLLKGPKSAPAVPYKLATLAYSANKNDSYTAQLDKALESTWADHLDANNWDSVIDLVSAHVSRLEKHYYGLQANETDPDKILTESQIATQAVVTAHSDLLQRPAVIFSPDQK
jgi:hypothetical protein